MQATVLYKILINSSAGTWNVASRNATWRFYDQNENSSNKTAWFLEIEAGDIDTLVSESSEMQTDLEALSATFYEPETACVCKLRFPSRAVCTEFCDEYQNKLYENMSSQGHSEIGNAGDWFFRPADAEPMEWDETPDAPPAAEEPATPKAWRQSSALNASTPQEVQGMVMGANDNSFVVQQGYIGVVRNEYGGVRGTGQGFAVTPPPRSAGGIGETRQNLTPGKMILAQGETHANLLSPEQNTSVYQVRREPHLTSSCLPVIECDGRRNTTSSWSDSGRVCIPAPFVLTQPHRASALVQTRCQRHGHARADEPGAGQGGARLGDQSQRRRGAHERHCHRHQSCAAR